jgi:hypothetical protein
MSHRTHKSPVLARLLNLRVRQMSQPCAGAPPWMFRLEHVRRLAPRGNRNASKTTSLDGDVVSPTERKRRHTARLFGGWEVSVNFTEIPQGERSFVPPGVLGA